MIETEGLSGADTLLRVLAHMGVDRIFASPGSEWSPVWEAFAKAKAQSEGVPLYITSRHEEIAVGMASGYAKSTGKLPAVMIHTTVGALHATMALRGALHEQVPMVVFTGESLGFGEEPGPDAGAQWLGALADIGGPASMRNLYCLRPSNAPANWLWVLLRDRSLSPSRWNISSTK